MGNHRTDSPRQEHEETGIDTGSEGTTSDLAKHAGVEKRIGQYKTVREIGHGGMGVVYLGVRADDQYRKHVAIKVIRAGEDHTEILRRFLQERQILASLDHPNIARLIDGGTTEEGLPYFVMDYIEGEHVDLYCDRRCLTVDERLRLFQHVCSAVSYAHRNLVVHRDIKPSNIIVTGDGVPKLLDFGIAKLLNPEVAGEVTVTATQLVFTPAYASPEQIQGMRATTASDVYSLGVILYKLLTGHSPYRVRTQSTLDLLKAVCEQEAERPSTVVKLAEESATAGGVVSIPATAESVSRTRDASFEGLRRRLRGDLDNILLTALHKDPHQRYPSVDAFSDDIQRHSEMRPVRARKATFAYTAGKFLRRNWLPVAAAMIVISMIVASSIVVTLQSQQARRERDKAERVAAFLVDLFKVADPEEARGNTITAREVLDKGAERIEGGLGDEPEVRATFMYTMGDVYLALGLHEKSAALHQKALDLRRKALGQDHPDVAASADSLALALTGMGKYAEAEPLHREALAMRRKLLGSEHLDVAASLRGLATNLYYQGKYAEAETLYRESLGVAKKLLGSDPRDVAYSLVGLAATLSGQGKYAEAEACNREALAMRRKVLGNVHPDVTASMTNLAQVLSNRGKFSEAELLLREAVATGKKLYGNEHPSLNTSVRNLAHVLYKQGKYAEAEALQREVLAIGKKVYGAKHPDVGAYLNNLAATLHCEGKYVEAEAVHREAQALLRERFGDEHPHVAYSLNNLAKAICMQGRYREAEALQRESLATARRLLGNEHPRVAVILDDLGNTLARHGMYAEAESVHREALGMRRKLLGSEHPEIAVSLADLAGVLAANGSYAEAEMLSRESVEMSRKLLGEEHPDFAHSLHCLAEVLVRQKRYAEAETPAREAIVIAEKMLPHEHPDISVYKGTLGAALGGLGRFKEAERLLLGSYASLNSLSGRESETHALLADIVRMYEASGQRKEAEKYRNLLDAERS